MRGSTTGNVPRVSVEVGQRFERLTVTRVDVKVGVSPTKPAGWRAAVCMCDCGTETVVALSSLTSGKKRSCGCLRREAAWLAEARHDWPTVHGLAAHPLYETSYGMMRRCYGPERSYVLAHYRDRGIRVHESWHNLATFVTEIEVAIGPRPEGKYPSGKPLYTLDRVDNDGNYEPGNIRWATATEQQNNKSRPPECSEEECSGVAKSYVLNVLSISQNVLSDVLIHLMIQI